MNCQLLKGKRVEAGLRQIDLARMLHVSEKTMNKKECSKKNLFHPNEMLALTWILALSAEEFNNIFFDGNLPDWLSKCNYRYP